MKIRTDFVTNSSSSSYITITLNGATSSVRLTGECDNFDYPMNGLFYEEIGHIISKDTKTIDQLLSNLREAYGFCFEDAFVEEHNGFVTIDDATTIIFEEEVGGDVSYNELEMYDEMDLLDGLDPNSGMKVVGKYTVKTGEYSSQKYIEDDDGEWKEFVEPEMDEEYFEEE